MSNRKITVTWAPSFHPEIGIRGEYASMTFYFKFFDDESDERIMDYVYASTNNYSGHIFRAMQEVGLPENRTHTALSVGDYIDIDGRSYVVSTFGFEKFSEQLVFQF